MLLGIEFLFILLLIFVFALIYKKERLSALARLSHASIEECWSGKERRKYTRFKRRLDVICTLEKKLRLKNNAETVDISEGGVKLLLDKKLMRDDIVRLKLELPGARGSMEVEGKVVWSEGAKDNNTSDKRFFHAGVMFSSIKEPSGESFLNYIRSLSTDPQL